LKRGDLATLRKHIKALRTVPRVLKIYTVLSKHAIQTLPVKDRITLNRLF